MKIIIVGHHSRIEWVAQLQQWLPGAAAVVDYSDRGAAWGHQQALRLAATYRKQAIIMEDDAIPVVGFLERARDWIERHPTELISFYLGTGRPPAWQKIVSAQLGIAQLDYIRVPKLLHAVCYTVPTDRLRATLEGIRRPEADFAIGAAWGRPILYPVESLVEHRDGPCVERHPDGQPRNERRVARKLAGPLMFDR